MQSPKLSILIAALIAISQYKSVTALTCNAGTNGQVTCAEGVTECFVKTVAGNVTRGCVTDTTCVAPTCLTCKTDNCNEARMCKQCFGSQPDCGRTNGSADAFNTLCLTATDQCAIVVAANGTVSRGCRGACAANDPNCKSCTTDNCNVGIFPENRRLCYQCNGDTCGTPDNASMLLGCDIYQATGQKCYTIGTSATTMQRGCQTDSTADNKCSASSTDPNCLFCDNENGCNNRPYSRVLGSCYKCNDADKCLLQQEAGKESACAPAVYTQNENSCYTQLFNNGSVGRGCTNELADGCETTQNCNACTGDNCNVNIATFQCLICRSDYYAPCRQAKVQPENCPASSLTGPQAMKCFSGEWDGVVVRGCLSEASALMQYQCTAEADTRCQTCTGLGCNRLVYNGAATLQQMGLGLFALISIVRHYF
ncbi:keratin-associated protein 5-4 [Drosophila hydei]|uniref:Keratin-associated protein 5-4 n=1 Tax=Drosophila hydei TaxID=7224 RepID=A0A6J1LP99_DROHY|nr:keratin-associated protein 5-4 [Drosophila hydei]